MRPNIVILPIAAAAPARAFVSLAALLARWIKAIAQARRHRRDAQTLAGLDRRMLRDIGLTRADVTDAFSSPFWEDPTALLRERALERRLDRSLGNVAYERSAATVENGFHRPRLDRPARQAI